MICIIFSSLCISTFAFSSPSDSLCACLHHVSFWVPGASPCSCNKITLGQISVGCCCACTSPRTWTNTDIFGILLTFFSHSCLGCHWLCIWRCMAAVIQTYCYTALCLASQTICTWVLIFLEASLWEVESLSSLQLVLLKVLSNWAIEGCRFFN